MRKFAYNEFVVIVTCLKLDPHVPVEHPRPLQASCHPLDTPTPHNCMFNYRKICQSYHAIHKEVNVYLTCVYINKN